MAKKRNRDDNPEWTKEDFARSVRVRPGTDLVQAAAEAKRSRGRPPVENPKQQVTLRLDADVLKAYRDSGRGWMVRINDTLRRSIARGAGRMR